MATNRADRRRPEHPASVAWRTIRPSFVASAIRQLKDHSKSQVFRLEGALADGAPVIGKMARTEVIEREGLLYRDIIPRLGVTSPAFLGRAPAEADGFDWLFTGDAGDRPFDPSDPEQLAAATRWLANFHQHTAELGRLPQLETRGVAFSGNLLARATDGLAAGLRDPSANTMQQALLERAIVLMATVRDHWPEIEVVMLRFPDTIVHGDFKAGNVRVRARGTDIEVLPLDWEFVGQGPPALDVARVDVAGYWEIVRDSWPGVSVDDVVRLGRVGAMLRLAWAICWLDWDLHHLSESTIVDRRLRAYGMRLESAIDRAGWTLPAGSRLV